MTPTFVPHAFTYIAVERMDDLGCDSLIFLFPDSQRSTLQRGASAIPPPPQSDNRCPLEKLETALKFLGLNVSEGQMVSE